MTKPLKYAFRITHIDNIPIIESHGFERADLTSKDSGYINIGDTQVIQVRSEKNIQGCRLNEYVPFYLGPRSPMLYVIQNGYNGVKRVEAKDIVYCVVRIDDLIENEIDCIFTDGHALSVLTLYYNRDKLNQISQIVKFEDVYSIYWNSDTDLDLKRRKEAELLIKNRLSPQYIKGYVVYSQESKQKLLGFGINEAKISVKPNYYF